MKKIELIQTNVIFVNRIQWLTFTQKIREIGEGPKIWLIRLLIPLAKFGPHSTLESKIHVFREKGCCNARKKKITVNVSSKDPQLFRPVRHLFDRHQVSILVRCPSRLFTVPYFSVGFSRLLTPLTRVLRLNCRHLCL